MLARGGEALDREVVERMKDAVLVARFPDRRILDVNPAFCRMFRLAREEALASTTERIHVDRAHFDRLGVLIGDAIRRGEPLVVEWPWRRADGTVFEAEITLSPFAAGAGEPVLAVSILRDVTETRARDAALRRLAGIVEASDDAIISCDVEGRVTSWNAGAEQLYGYSRAETLGGPITVMMAPAARAAWTRLLPRVLAGETIHLPEEERIRKDGERRWVALNIFPLRDAGGAVIGVSGIARDVTDRVLAEAAIREQRELYAALIDAQTQMGDGIVLIEGLRIVWANEAFFRLVGYAPEEVYAPSFDLFALAAPEERERLLARTHLRDSSDRLTGHYDVTIVRKDGRRLVVEHSTLSRRDGDTMRSVSILRDVTERKRADDELARARVQLSHSEKMSALGTMVAGVAHEIRTPLTYLSTNLDLLDRAVAGDAAVHARVKPFLSDALEAAMRINRIVADLGRYTRRRAGERASARLDEVAEAAVTLFRATQRGAVEVRFSAQPTAARSLDVVEIQQVVLNLLDNAVAAKPRDGAVHVAVREEQDGWAELEVRDRGCGMPESVRERMWDPFFTTKADGSGLGLSIARRIAEAHRAQISCESAEGEGTTFRVRFPPA